MTSLVVIIIPSSFGGHVEVKVPIIYFFVRSPRLGQIISLVCAITLAAANTNNVISAF